MWVSEITCGEGVLFHISERAEEAIHFPRSEFNKVITILGQARLQGFLPTTSGSKGPCHVGPFGLTALDRLLIKFE